MIGGKLTILPALMLSTFLFLTGCDETTVVGDMKIWVQSPVEQAMYNNSSPTLQIVATEGENSTPISEDRLSGGVYDKNATNDLVNFQAMSRIVSGEALPSLTDGNHVLEIVAASADETFSVTVMVNFATDVTAPGMTFNYPADGETVGSATIIPEIQIVEDCFFSEDPSTKCTLMVFVNGTQDTDLSDGLVLEEGANTIKVVITDQAKNTSEITHTVIVDTKPPEVVVSEPPPPTPEPTPVDPVVTVNEASTVDVVVTNSAGTIVYTDSFTVDDPTIETTLPLSMLSPDTYTVKTTVTDPVGNMAEGSYTYTVPDIGFPVVTVVQPRGLFATQTVPVEYTASDNVTMAGYFTVNAQVYRPEADGTKTLIAGSAFDPVAGTLNVPVDGTFQVVISVSDEAGNTTNNATDIRIDTTPPVVEINAPVSGSTVFSGKPKLDVLASEPSSWNAAVYLFPGSYRAYDETDRLAVAIDGNLQQPDGSPLLDGEYTVVVAITDEAGWTGSAFSTFIVNAAPPNATILNPSEGELVGNGKVNLKYTVNDAHRVEIWLRSDFDPNPAEPAFVRVITPIQPVPRTYENSLNLKFDGLYSVTIQAFDETGDHPLSETSVNFVLDSTKPVVDITSPASGLNVSTGDTVAVNYQVSNATHVEVTLDGVKVDEYTLDIQGTVQRSITVGPFETDGAHEVSISVRDGNGQTDSEAIRFLVDGDAPVVTIRTPEDGAEYSDTTLTLYYTVEELNKLTQEVVRLDGSEMPGVKSGDTLIDLPPGEHVIEVQVVDQAGNVSGTATSNFTIAMPEEDEHLKRRGKSSCVLEMMDGGRPFGDNMDALLRCVREDKNHDD